MGNQTLSAQNAQPATNPEHSSDRLVAMVSKNLQNKVLSGMDTVDAQNAVSADLLRCAQVITSHHLMFFLLKI